ncbi:MAG: transposase, partial [Candidatus Aminicenantes bacterium]|nr:transposase [Candidatus Aminicenantes bacterium]
MEESLAFYRQTVEELTPILQRIWDRWPQTQIVLRADSGFAREEILAWCEANGIDYVFGLAK